MALRVLVALDGSEQSLRAVAHVEKVMLEGCCCDVTLFHVSGIPAEYLEHEGSSGRDPEGQAPGDLRSRRAAWEEETRAKVENEIFGPARRLLLKESHDRVSSRLFSKLDLEPHHRVASSILWEAERGDYDAVVVGRRGLSNVEGFLLGSVSSKVIHHLQGRTVWVVE